MKRILIVDDDDDIRETTGELLRLRGYEVTTVGRVEDVRKSLRETPPDLVLLDCHMPGLDLASLIQSIRAQPPLRLLPVLLFTASIEAEGFWRAVGADGMIRKPFEAKELEAAIHRFLSKLRSVEGVPMSGGGAATTPTVRIKPAR